MKTKKIRIVTTLICLLFPVIFLCGCKDTANEIYNKTSDAFELDDDELKAFTEGKLELNSSDENGSNLDIETGDLGTGLEGMGERARSKLYYMVSAICTWAKTYGYLIAIASAFIGVIIMRLFKKSINVRRKAFLFLVLGIPIIIVVLMYGSAFLADSV